MKSSREIASFKIQPTDGASAGWQTGLDSRKRALVSEEKKIVNNRYFLRVCFTILTKNQLVFHKKSKNHCIVVSS